jgi:tetratricopeptide (TPR) repeat protein
VPSTAEEVGGHLVAVGLFLDDEPERALTHAKAAKQLAARLGCTREALGLAAYRNGDFTLALSELRAARRMGGGAELLPVLADCERGLGRPDRALAIGKDPAVADLDRPGRVELAMVLSGARRDLGQPEAAVLVLQGKELDSGEVHPWTPRLWYAYADALLAAGRHDEAAEWFRAVAAEDDEGEFDAEERLAAL